MSSNQENEIEKPRIRVRIRTDDQNVSLSNNGIRIKIKDKNGNEYEGLGIPTPNLDQKPLSLLPVYDSNSPNSSSPKKTVRVCLKGNGQVIESKVLNQVSGFKIVLNNQNQNNEMHIVEKSNNTNTNTNTKNIHQEQIQIENVEEDWQPVEGYNNDFTGRKFGILMKLHASIINNDNYGGDAIKDYAVSLINEAGPFLNPAGLKLDLRQPNIERDPYQQFTFGKTSWDTVIDSFVRQGMVWDVANADDINPKSGTPFYLFPFHGRHNQHFVLKDRMIYAKQNGQVVTYVGGEFPFVMMRPKESLRERQTFYIRLL